MAVESSVKPVESGPVDHKNVVYMIFYWLGIGTLLPWNFFITVVAYWEYKLRSVNSTFDAAELVNSTVLQRNDMQTHWPSQLSVAAMVPNVSLLLINAAFGHHFRTIPRLLVSLVIVIVLFGFTMVMAQVNTDEWQNTFMIITLVSVVFININSAIFQGGLLGLAGKFPPKYMGGVFSGQALGGIFASITNVLVIALGADQVDSAFYCFLVAVLFLGSALVFFLVILRSDFFHFYLDERPKNVQTLESAKENGGAGDQAAKLMEEEVEVRKPKAKVNPLLILGKISLYAASVYLLFLVTLTCFPAITALVVSTGYAQGGAWSQKYFVIVCCFVLFNVGDWAGRFLAEHIQWPRPGRAGMIIVFTLTLLRFSFIPLFLFCNINPSGRQVTRVFFESDLAYIIFMSVFSVSNGYLASICMMSAPQVCKNEEAQTAASIMVALLGLGLGSGALLSNAVLTAL